MNFYLLQTTYRLDNENPGKRIASSYLLPGFIIL